MTRRPPAKLLIGPRRDSPNCRRRLVPLSSLYVAPHATGGHAVVGVDLVAAAETTLCVLAREADALDLLFSLPRLLGPRPTDADLGFVADFFADRPARLFRGQLSAAKAAKAAKPAVTRKPAKPRRRAA